MLDIKLRVFGSLSCSLSHLFTDYSACFMQNDTCRATAASRFFSAASSDLLLSYTRVMFLFFFTPFFFPLPFFTVSLQTVPAGAKHLRRTLIVFSHILGVCLHSVSKFKSLILLLTCCTFLGLQRFTNLGSIILFQPTPACTEHQKLVGGSGEAK